MKEIEKLKTGFDKDISHKTTKDFALTQNQKKQLKDEFIEFAKSHKEQIEIFIDKKREYIEDYKYTSMIHYLEKLKDESEAL